MSPKFGWCFGPDGAVGDHHACPAELGTSGVIVRCGCDCHEEED